MYYDVDINKIIVSLLHNMFYFRKKMQNYNIGHFITGINGINKHVKISKPILLRKMLF